jgi:aspartyl-tRNA(Asn)/glutamyl-tRNA(Gln) amidotransferase subunit A
MDFRNESVADLAEQVRERKVSARELTEAALARIDALDGDINAFVALDPEAALAEAGAIDERVAGGDPVGALAGIPIGVKDLEDARGFVTTHGSPVRADASPSTADSPEVARLRAAGCVILGKTNTPEFGHKADTDNSVFGRTRNPWDLGRSAGGSSGGTAAALAAGMVPLATGSDGGGSIRIPAAVCGLSGIKTSAGRVPMGGPSPTHWGNLSVRGPMTRRIRDTALALDVVVGPDPTDLRSLPAPNEPWSPHLRDPRSPTRVGWSPTLGYAAVDREIVAVCEQAVRQLEGLGIEVVDVDEVWPTDPIEVWYLIASAHNLRALGEYRGQDVWDDFDPMLQTSIEWADHTISATDYLRAEDQIHRLHLRLAEVLADLDVLLCPTTAGQTPVAGDSGTIDGEHDLNWVKMTYPFNLTRSPAGSVCAGFTADGLPVGLQVVGAQHDDLGVLRALAVFEDALAIDAVAPFGVA